MRTAVEIWYTVTISFDVCISRTLLCGTLVCSYFQNTVSFRPIGVHAGVAPIAAQAQPSTQVVNTSHNRIASAYPTSLQNHVISARVRRWEVGRRQEKQNITNNVSTFHSNILAPAKKKEDTATKYKFTAPLDSSTLYY